MARGEASASVVQVYTTGLRFETEIGVDAPESNLGTSSDRVWHSLPMDCPLYDAPEGQRSLWTALWQVACLLRPEWSPNQWRPRLRRLARIAGALTVHGDPQLVAVPSGQSDLTALDERMAEWVRRLMPSSQMPARGIQRSAIEVREATGMDLAGMEVCQRHGGALLVAWRRVSHSTDHANGRRGSATFTAPNLHWRMVAGLGGTQGSRGKLLPSSVLLLPQSLEAVWGCGYGMRLDPVVRQDANSPQTQNLWQLRGLDGRWTVVEMVRVLMLDAT